MSGLTEDEIKVFTEAVTNYFSQITQEASAISGAYLEESGESAPMFDFTGKIDISGKYHGSIIVSAPRAMIRHLLLAQHENNHTNENMRDIVGELANTIAGNARKHFGEHMDISIPSTCDGALRDSAVARTRPYVIMVQWKSYQISLIVDIERS
jgi:chemotaxis protein CheX